MDLPFNHMDLQISLRTCKYCQSLKSFLLVTKWGGWIGTICSPIGCSICGLAAFSSSGHVHPTFFINHVIKPVATVATLSVQQMVGSFVFLPIGRIGVPWITEHSSAINRCNVVAPPRGPSWDWDWQSHPSSLRFPDPCYVMVLWIAYSVGHHRSGQMIKIL